MSIVKFSKKSDPEKPLELQNVYEYHSIHGYDKYSNIIKIIVKATNDI